MDILVRNISRVSDCLLVGGRDQMVGGVRQFLERRDVRSYLNGRKVLGYEVHAPKPEIPRGEKPVVFVDLEIK